MRYLQLVPVVLIIIFFALGCSGGSQDPVTLEEPLKRPLTGQSDETSRLLLGMFGIKICPYTLEVSPAPLRMAAGHRNVTWLLTPPACDDCIIITVNDIDWINHILNVDMQIRNPHWADVYDVRTIVHTTDAGHLLTNEDGWTSLWGKLGGEDIDPFKAYAKTETLRTFESGEIHTENFIISFPASPDCWNLTFAVDCSWPSNCNEPYSIENFQQLGELYDGVGSEADLQVDVLDWQSDVDKVVLEAPEITGEPSTQFVPMGGDTWGMTLVNNEGAPEGDYDVLLWATSADSAGLALYDYATVTITAGEQEGWARTWGGDSSESGYAVTVDDFGNTYITGCFRETTDLDPGPGIDEHTSNGNTDVYLIKIDSSGDLQWARTWGGSSFDWGQAIDADASGNVYVVGYFKETVDFDPGPGVYNRISNGDGDIFLSKFNSNGDFQWAVSWGGDGRDEGHGVAVDAFSNIYVTGTVEGSVDFDPGPDNDYHGADYNSYDPFLSKFDSSGGYHWARTWGAIMVGDKGYGVAVDSDSIYVTGCFGYIVDFDPGPEIDEHTSNGGSDVFLSKFNTNGDFQWALTWGGTEGDCGYGVSTAASGNIYVTGTYMDTADFDPGVGEDIHDGHGCFLSKFSQSGGFQWARTWGGESTNDFPYGEEVAADGYDNTYVTGWFRGTVDFDPGPGINEHTVDGWTDVFLSKFDSGGNYQWARIWGGPGTSGFYSDDIGYGVAVDNSGNSYTTGHFMQTVDFDPGPGTDYHTNPNVWSCNAFLNKILPDGYW